MSQVVEAVARAIDPRAFELREASGDIAFRRMVETAERQARAAIEALAANVTDETVRAARLALIPMADEVFMEDYREECESVIRSAIAAAIRAALTAPPTRNEPDPSQ